MPDCKYGDPTCPCQDGGPCHYEGPDAMNVPPEYVRNALAAAATLNERLVAFVRAAHRVLDLIDTDENYISGDSDENPGDGWKDLMRLADESEALLAGMEKGDGDG